MTDAQFKAALKRNGFCQELLWFKHPEAPRHRFGGIVCTKRKRLNRRATLAKILADRDAVIAKNKAKGQQ